MDEVTWFDEEAGPLVRPYAMTGGRTRTGQSGLELITLVVAAGRHTELSTLEQKYLSAPEYQRILALCRHPKSVAEVSAELTLPLGVAKVLIGDLIDHQLVVLSPALAPNHAVLQAVLNGIRKL